MKALCMVGSDSKSYKGVTDSILYLEHAIKGRWRIPTKHHKHRYVWSRS